MNALPRDPDAELARLQRRWEDSMAEIGLGIPPVEGETAEEELNRLTARYSAEIAIGLAQARAKESRSDKVRLEAIKDRCRLQGIQLHEIDGEDGQPLFVAVKWACIATFHTVGELAAWLSRIDGKQE